MTVDLTTFEPATATIKCQEQTHFIRWEAGELTAEDHGDTEGELALAALGGTQIPCLQVLAAWRAQRSDRRLLSAITRGAGDHVETGDARHQPGRPPVAVARRMQMRRARTMAGAGWAGRAQLAFPSPVASTGPPTGDEQIEILARLGGVLPWRLAATVTSELLRSCTDAEASAPAKAALEASLYGRARSSLSTWRGSPNLEIELRAIDPDESPHLHATADDDLLVSLPFNWVAEVWGRGLAIVGERFSLAIVDIDTNRVVIDTIGPDLRDQRHIAIESA